MLGRLVALLIALAAAAPAVAQSALEVPPPILTIDQDRLFSETRIGKEALVTFENDAAALSQENDEIEQRLIEEEQALTLERDTLDPAEFREKADAFDARVQQIRAEQDAKARALRDSRDQAQQDFYGEVADIISAIVRERGALVVLDRRDVFLSADSIDITDQAISRINQAEGGQ